MTNKLLIPLTPVRIKSDVAAYKSVEELSEVLEKAKEYGIKNVALTGPYGSGKSSILKTLREDFLNKSENLHSLLKCGCSRIEEDVVIYKNESGEEKQLPYDQLILSTGLVAQRQLVESFYGICRDTVAIGDCVSPSNIMNANFEGYTAALNI